MIISNSYKKHWQRRVSQKAPLWPEKLRRQQWTGVVLHIYTNKKTEKRPCTKITSGESFTKRQHRDTEHYEQLGKQKCQFVHSHNAGSTSSSLVTCPLPCDRKFGLQRRNSMYLNFPVSFCILSNTISDWKKLNKTKQFFTNVNYGVGVGVSNLDSHGALLDEWMHQNVTK